MSVSDEVFRHSQENGLGAERAKIVEFVALLVDYDEQAQALASDAIARLWKQFLDLESQKRSAADSIEKIAFLSWYENLISTANSEWARAFQSVGFNFVRTQLEVRLRLGSRLFSRGRKPGQGTDSGSVRKALLPRAIQVFTDAESQVRHLSESRQRLLYGMRGVARLFLARDETKHDTAAKDLLRGAVQDLQKSGEFGDHTPEHDEYLREALIKLFEFEPENWILDRLQPLFDAATKRNRQFYADRGRLLLGRATILESGPDRNSLLNDAITSADLGLNSEPDIDTSDVIFLSQRGFARFLLSQGEDDQSKLPSLLKSAVADLREAAKIGLGGAALSQALLSASYVSRRENPQESLTYLGEAAKALSQVNDEILRDRLQKQISANETGTLISICVSEENTQGLSELCNRLLELSDELVRSFSLSLINAARLLYKTGQRDLATAIGLQTVAHIERILSSSEFNEDPHTIYVLDSNAASLLRTLGEEHYDHAYDLYRKIITETPDEVLAPTLTAAGDIALQLGKRSARAGNPVSATHYFLDSVEWYEKGLAQTEKNPEQIIEGFLPVVCHSKLGEAYVRLQSVHPTADYPPLALRNLEIARSLGNTTPELLGIMADAHYRFGLFHKDGDALRRAHDLKRSAREAGHTSRENWSVSASIAGKMRFHDSDPKWGTEAIHAAVEAYHVDPNWPWPLFQIAEFMDTTHAHRAADMIDELERPQLAGIKNQINRLAKSEIEFDAVRLAISSAEFKRRILGGRTRVYVLDDPHGLLSTSVVLKPTSLKNANQEITALTDFRNFLKSNKREDHFLLPDAICVIQQDEEKAVYAMRRAVGRRLSEALLTLGAAGRTDRIEFELRRALKYLALFHAWSAKNSPPRVSSRVGRFEMALIQNGLSLSTNDAAELALLSEKAFQTPLVQLRKKDAHAENWIVAGEGLMMIDLEATGYRPLLFEVAQLIDDFGFLPTDSKGIETRLALAQYYIASLRELGISVEMERSAVECTYCLFWVLRSAFGIGLYRRRQRYSSSSSLRLIAMRHEHYYRSLTYLTANGPSEAIRRLAEWVATR
jgi:hypothetical protein